MFDKERMFAEMRRAVTNPSVNPIKRAVIWIFLHKIESKHLEMTKDPMRGWRPLKDSKGELLHLRSAMLAYDDIRPDATKELLARLLPQIQGFRGLVYDVEIDGYAMLCSAIFCLKAGSLLVVFPRPADKRHALMAFVMGNEDRENDAPEVRFIGRQLFALFAGELLDAAE